MRPANTVGGDYFDVIELDERRLAITVGDVAGKGMPAALLMALLQGSLRTLITAGLRGPELIGKLNDHLCANIPSNRLVTLFYAEYDTASGELEYVNAGHNAPFVLRADGTLQRLDATGPPFLRGTDDFQSEELLAYELGYRTPLGDTAFLDLATFFNDFDNLQSVEVDGSGIQFYDNKVQAEAMGVEVALDVDLSERWRLRSTYAWFEMDFEADGDSAEAATVDTKDGLVPENRATLRSYYDLGSDWEFDTGIYWTDDHSSSFFENPAYWRVDVRLGWNPSEHLQLSIGVQNAQTDEHPEAGEDIYWYGSLVERLYYVSLRATY